MRSDIVQFSPDDQLLLEMRENDRGAFEKIYNRYWSKLYLSAYNILRDKQSSEDIIQELFIQLWLKRNHQNIDNLKSYLFTAIRFQVFKAIRDGKVQYELRSEALEIASSDDIESLLTEKDINRRLDESIKLLPERCREIFILSRMEHLSIREIAARLDVAPKTVENQITIALKKIRANMGDLMFWAIVLLADIWKK